MCEFASLLFHQNTATSSHVLLPFLRGAEKTVYIKYMKLFPLCTQQIYNRRRICPKAFFFLDDYLTAIFQKPLPVSYMSAADVLLDLLQDLRSLQSKDTNDMTCLRSSKDQKD